MAQQAKVLTSTTCVTIGLGDSLELGQVISGHRTKGSGFSSSFNIFLFLRFYFSYNISAFPLLPPYPPVYPSLLSFKFRASFLIHCYCIHICTCTCIHTAQYSPLGPCNMSCMYAFIAASSSWIYH